METVGGASIETVEPIQEYDEVVKECRERARHVKDAINKTAMLVKKFGNERRNMTVGFDLLDWLNHVFHQLADIGLVESS